MSQGQSERPKGAGSQATDYQQYNPLRMSKSTAEARASSQQRQEQPEAAEHALKYANQLMQYNIDHGLVKQGDRREMSETS